MDRKGIKNASDGDLIVEYVYTHASFAVNLNSPDRGIKKLSQHLADLDAELLKRGILNQDQIDRLNL